MSIKWGQEVVFKINHVELEGENPHMRVTLLDPEAWEEHLSSKKQAERQNTPKRNPSPEKAINSLLEKGGKTKKKESPPEEQQECNFTLPLSQFKKTLKVHSTPIPGASDTPSKSKKRKSDVENDQQITKLMEMTKKSLQEPPSKRRKKLTHKKSHNEDKVAGSSSEEQEEAPSKKDSPLKETKAQNGRSVTEKASVSKKANDSDSSSDSDDESALPKKLKNTLEKIVLSQETSPKPVSTSPEKRHASPEKESKLKMRDASPEKVSSQRKKGTSPEKDASPEKKAISKAVPVPEKEEKKEKSPVKKSKPLKRRKEVSPLRTAENGASDDLDADEGLAELSAMRNALFATMKLPSFDDEKPAEKILRKKPVKVDTVKEPEAKKKDKDVKSKKEEPKEKQKPESKKERSKKKEDVKEKEAEKPETKKKSGGSKKSGKVKDSGTEDLISKLLGEAKGEKTGKKKGKKEKEPESKKAKEPESKKVKESESKKEKEPKNKSSVKAPVDFGDLSSIAKMLLDKQIKGMK